ncbi:ferredoxin [Lentzea sp. NBRC 105346]|uniref:ferredoxin n=1 Tax=Lentzea sp. NBRC 105346 TaxID=3032205 RepID=UPI0024A1687C|nr:ferredoxin [Lentzea sp. NBRC 105346]GLZ31792.1 ferredoxin [Lentzea sp. NBRC 105346]
MRVSVDHALCEANGLCVGILPEVFDLDDDELLQVREGVLTDDEEERGRLAVTTCPKRALAIRE